MQNQKTKEQIESLLQDGKHRELRQRLCCRLSFGTAGLRSAMGAGFCYINDLTVIQSTQVSGGHRGSCGEPLPGGSPWGPAGSPELGAAAGEACRAQSNEVAQRAWAVLELGQCSV